MGMRTRMPGLGLRRRIGGEWAWVSARSGKVVAQAVMAYGGVEVAWGRRRRMGREVDEQRQRNCGFGILGLELTRRWEQGPIQRRRALGARKPERSRARRRGGEGQVVEGCEWSRAPVSPRGSC